MRELFGLQKDEFFIGMIFGFPDGEEQDIVDNYTFLKEIDADTSYCQVLTTSEMPSEILQLMELYRQPVKPESAVT